MAGRSDDEARDVGGEEHLARRTVLLELNASVARAALDFSVGQRDDNLWDFTCECGAAGCFVQVPLSLAEYQALRAAGESVLAPGHH